MADRAELCWLDIEEASRLLRTRELSPVELTTAVLDQIAALDDQLHAFITLDPDGALDAARAAEREIAAGPDRGPLHGIPVSVKDNFFTARLRTTSASRIYESWIPDHDATVIERLRAAGTVLVGKANMFELATGWGTSGHFPLAVNPWGAAHTPGGSSSGSAVAVASGMGYASLGTDGGGSVRVPSNYCGVTGFKPTYGLVSSYGTIPVGPSVSHVGVIARSVRSAALLFQAIVGHDARDPASVRASATDYVGGLLGNAEGLRIGIPWNYLDGHLSVESGGAFETSLRVMEDAGASLVEFELPSPDQVAPLWMTIVYAELAAFHEERFHRAPEDFGPELGQRIAEGLATPATVYFRAQETRSLLRAACAVAMRDVDLIATPTAPGPAPLVEELRARASKLQDIGQLARYTRPYNLTGLPAITVPGGFTNTGLPLGFELAGRQFEDAVVLRAADAYQRRTAWHQQRPPAVHS